MQPTEIAHFKNRIRQVVAKQANRILHSKLEKAVDPTQVHTGGPDSIAPDIERIKQIAIELRGAVHASGGTHHHATLEPHPLPPLPSVSIPARFDLAYPALPTYPSFVDFFDEKHERFLHRLFTHLLHREPDEAGLEHLLEQLQSGDSQLEVLLHIWASQERKLLGTQLAGIRRAKRLLFLSNLPLIGRRFKSKLGPSTSGKKSIQFSATTLQQYEDEGFVRSAYRVILRREPDTQGLRHYLNQIRSGISKVKIIRNLRASLEGQEAATVLHDITYASMVETLEAIPVIRWIAFPFIVHYRTYRVAKLAKLANSTLIANTNARAAAADSAFQRILIAIGERDQISNIQACITRDAITSLQGSIDATSKMIAESAKRSPWIAYDERIRKLEKKTQSDHDHLTRLVKLEDGATRSDDIYRVVFSAIEDSRKTSQAFALELKNEVDLLRQDILDTARVVSAVPDTPSRALTALPARPRACNLHARKSPACLRATSAAHRRHTTGHLQPCCTSSSKTTEFATQRLKCCNRRSTYSGRTSITSSRSANAPRNNPSGSCTTNASVRSKTGSVASSKAYIERTTSANPAVPPIRPNCLPSQNNWIRSSRHSTTR